MSETCSHHCAGCSKNCASRTEESRFAPLRQGSQVKKVIGVVSGKGGVGKSMVTSLMAVTAMKKGFRTAILDADITGPSIPQAFGLHVRAEGDDNGILPVVTKGGIEVMSLNLLVDHETDPVVWRGPVIAKMVKQFWSDVLWGEIDYMFIDMPPGTGDVPLTVFQSLPVDGIIMVASPQELVGMVVEKAVNMAHKMNIPVLGLVENMSYALCPCCGEKLHFFGESRAKATAEKHSIPHYAQMPIDPKLAAACDAGSMEDVSGDWLNELFNQITK